MMEWNMDSFVIRPWKKGDDDSIVKYANNLEVAKNLKDRFPHPYTIDDAINWIEIATAEALLDLNWAIVIEGEAAGGIGLDPGTDIYRYSAEIGYWLGEKYWGKGIMTKAVSLITDYGLSELGLHRIFTSVYQWNPGSMRVLEKNGYTLEGVQRKSVYKNGQIIDSSMYSRIRD